LRCYHDDSFYFQTGTIDCDALPTGINDVASIEHIKLYPDPVGNELNLMIPNNLLKDNTEIVIANIEGKEAAHYRVSSNTIDVSALLPGIYLAKIILKNTVSIVKFMKK